MLAEKKKTSLEEKCAQTVISYAKTVFMVGFLDPHAQLAHYVINLSDRLSHTSTRRIKSGPEEV